MTAQEFNKTVKIDDTSTLRTIVDLRPFKKRQGEAFDFYFHDLPNRERPQKPILIYYTRGTEFLPSSMAAYQKLLSENLAIGMEEKEEAKFLGAP
jgi:hypothetical protein